MGVPWIKLLAPPRRFPFTTWALIALALETGTLLFDLAYDDAGLGSALILTFPVWGFPYWATRNILFALNKGRAFAGYDVAWVTGGLTLCILADFAVHRFRQRRKSAGKVHPS